MLALTLARYCQDFISIKGVVGEIDCLILKAIKVKGKGGWEGGIAH